MAYSGVADNGGAGGVALPEAILDVFSLEILHNAQGVMKYEDFAVRKTELSKVQGETVKFTRYNDITRGGKLVEGDPIVTQNMSASQISITVDEFGNGTEVSEKLLLLSWDEPLTEAAVLLGRDYAVVRDLDLRDVVVASGSTIFTTPTAAALGDVLPADTFDVESIRVATEDLQTANAPKFLNDFYVCIIHPHQASHLKRDPDWVSAHQYAGSRNIFNGEIGRLDDVIFISTTHQGNGAAPTTDPGYDATLDASGAASQDLYRATMMADQAYGLADALPVEMRDGGVFDFGRQHKLAWYAIWGAGILHSNYIVHIISS